MINIRRATPGESEDLTNIATESEAHWGGSTEFLERFRELYRVTASFIKDNPTYVLEEDGDIMGFYGVVVGKDVSELEYLYVKACCIGKGYGRMLWEHLEKRCRELGIPKLELVTSPEAKSFYIKMGAAELSMVESIVQNGRMIPKLSYMVKA